MWAQRTHSQTEQRREHDPHLDLEGIYTRKWVTCLNEFSEILTRDIHLEQVFRMRLQARLIRANPILFCWRVAAGDERIL